MRSITSALTSCEAARNCRLAAYNVSFSGVGSRTSNPRPCDMQGVLGFGVAALRLATNRYVETYTPPPRSCENTGKNTENHGNNTSCHSHKGALFARILKRHKQQSNASLKPRQPVLWRRVTY